MTKLDKTTSEWEVEFDKNWINPWERNNFGIPKAHLDIKQFIATQKAKWIKEERARVIKAVLKVADKYWINKYVGMPASVVVNKNQFRAIIEDELKRKHEKIKKIS